MGCVFETLQQASAIGPLFSFVPETYITILPLLLDTIMDFSFHDTGVQHNLCGKFFIQLFLPKFR